MSCMINSPDVEIAINLSYVQCFPVRNGCDVFPPWITPLVKYLLKKKKRAADKGHFHKSGGLAIDGRDSLDDKDCNYVRLFAMDFSKAFDNVKLISWGKAKGSSSQSICCLLVSKLSNQGNRD